jgi:poly-gamma-glutamate capsule biosynthesis protein CapA/YwtB (metallophosphatase superfamily)
MLILKRIQKNSLLCIVFIFGLLLASCSVVINKDAFTGSNAAQPETTPSITQSNHAGSPSTDKQQGSQDAVPTAAPTPTPEPSPSPRGTTGIRLRAVGDIMMHMPQVNAGLQADGSYDYNHFFGDIKPYLTGADIVTGNLETTISNKEKGYGGYPMFRTPEALLQALKEAGFNVLTTANNHTFDGREFGVVNTLDKLDEYGFLHTGSARSQKERDSVLLIEKNDIKAAMLAYTYGTNGMEATISDEKLPFMVNYIDRDKIREDVNRAREEGAEVIIVSIHWGDEYVRTPNNFQKETADFLASLGVDIILGSHAHVLQPMERRKIAMDDGTEKEIFIIYSLGNFISNQRDKYRDSGVIVDLEIIKDYDRGTIELGEISYTPTWVYRFTRNGKSDYRILPVGKFLEEEELNGSARDRIRSVWNETTSHLGQKGFKINE